MMMMMFVILVLMVVVVAVCLEVVVPVGSALSTKTECDYLYGWTGNRRRRLSTKH